MTGCKTRRASTEAPLKQVFALSVVVLLVAVRPGAAWAEAIRNGSFEEALSNWEPTRSRPGPGCAVVADAHTGTKAVRVENRSAPTDGVGQDVRAALDGLGSGVRYTLRLWVRVDAPASVRAWIRLVDDSGERKALVAEKVVRARREWVLVEGTQTVSWDGELAAADLNFEVAQVPERAYPSFTIDDVSLAPDADGDRLTDPEEAGLGTDPALVDTDGDGLPDGWEVAHRFDPRIADAEGDPDADGFSSYQEYWAATDPCDASSRPGRPSNAEASARTRSVLRYLALLPARKEHRAVVGQHVTNVDPEYQTDVVRLHEDTGRWVGLLALQYDGQRHPLQIEAVNPTALAWWKAGGLVKIKWSVCNPWTGGNRNDRPARGEPDYIDIRGLIDPKASRDPTAVEANRKAREVYLGWLDEVAAGLTELRDAGVVVLWRPISEMNGRWFWWGGRPREDYIAMWRHMHDYFSREKGLDNLLWVYESDSSVHPMIASDYYYPGDDVVDVMGHNFYNDTWDLPFDADYVYRQYPKVYAFPQAGPGRGIRDGSWDNMTYVRMIQARYPRCSFFAAWNSFTWKGGRERVHLAIVDNRNARQLLEHPWIVTRDLVDWRGGPQAAGGTDQP